MEYENQQRISIIPGFFQFFNGYFRVFSTFAVDSCAEKKFVKLIQKHRNIPSFIEIFNIFFFLSFSPQIQSHTDPTVYYKEKELACPWISSSNDNLDKEAFIGFESPILSTVLNSPPESVDSNHIYEDDSIYCNTSDLMESEQSFNFVLAQPYEHSQDFLHTDLHNEIDQIANEHKYSMLSNNECEIDDHSMHNDDDDDDDEEDIDDDEDTPILGNADLMIGSPTSAANAINSQEEILNETMNNNNTNIVNMNKAQCTLLLKRNQCLPQLQLTATFQMMPVQNDDSVKMAQITTTTTTIAPPVAEATTEEEKPANNGNGVISTPQLEDEILEMEGDFRKFDLISYIDSNDTNVSKHVVRTTHVFAST